MVPLYIHTSGRILTVEAQTQTATATLHFAMNTDRELSGKLESLLTRLRLTDRGPLVYIGGAWHDHSSEDATNGPEATTSASDPSAQAYVHPDRNPEELGQERSRIGSSTDAESENEVTSRFIHHPPQSIINALEDYHFNYLGVDPSLTGADPTRQNVARIIHVFESLPPGLTGDRDWSSPVTSTDALDWEPQIPDEELKTVSEAGDDSEPNDRTSVDEANSSDDGEDHGPATDQDTAAESSDPEPAST